jgi:hypothetical protein
MKAVVTIWPPDALGPGYTWRARVVAGERRAARSIAIVKPVGRDDYKSAKGAADAAASTLRQLLPEIPIELEIR